MQRGIDVRGESDRGLRTGAGGGGSTSEVDGDKLKRGEKGRKRREREEMGPDERAEGLREML